MKGKLKNKINWWLCLCCCYFPLVSPAQQDSSKKPERQSLVYIQYYLENNQIPYVKVQTKSKEDRAFLPVARVSVSVYLDKDSSADALVGRVVTNRNGEASMGLPTSLASAWKNGSTHTFYARAASTNNFNAVSEQLP